ncbi:MAG: hypothetical protein ACO38P_08525, partial [Phycisphaerales bacterium]
MPNRPARRLPTSMFAVSAVAFSLLSGTSIAEPPTLEAWSNEVWTAAMGGDLAEVEKLLGEVPTGKSGVTESFREMVASRNEHATESDEGRRKELDQAIADLGTHLEAGELTKALTAAVRAQTLSEDWGGALDRPEIAGLIRDAEEAEVAAEAAGDWLLAQEILFRLRTLHEDVGRGDDYKRYHAGLERVNRRIGLIAQYAPMALHDLRVKQVARIAPEQELPEFNPAFAEDWKEQVRGISQPML